MRLCAVPSRTQEWIQRRFWKINTNQIFSFSFHFPFLPTLYTIYSKPVLFFIHSWSVRTRNSATHTPCHKGRDGKWIESCSQAHHAHRIRLIKWKTWMRIKFFLPSFLILVKVKHSVNKICGRTGFHLLSSMGFPLLSSMGFHLLSSMGFPLLSSMGFPLLSSMGFPFLSSMGFHLLSSGVDKFEGKCDG